MAPPGNNRYEWEQGTLVASRGVIAKLCLPDCTAVRAIDYLKALVVSLAHVGPNLLIELWDAVWPTGVCSGGVPGLGPFANDLGAAAKGGLVAGGVVDATWPWVRHMIAPACTPLRESSEGGMLFWAKLLSKIMAPGRFKMVCCGSCKKDIVAGETPRWNVLSHFKPNVPVFLQDRWLDGPGREACGGKCAIGYGGDSAEVGLAVNGVAYWRDHQCTVMEILPTTEMIDGVRVRLDCARDNREFDGTEQKVERSFLRSTRPGPPYVECCAGAWPSWFAGIVRELGTGRPVSVRQPTKRILQSVLSFYRCLFEVNRVESSSARARNDRDGVVSRPNNNPALNYSSIRCVCRCGSFASVSLCGRWR